MATGNSAAVGAISWKKPNHIITLWFSEVVDDQGKWNKVHRPVYILVNTKEWDREADVNCCVFFQLGI